MGLVLGKFMPLHNGHLALIHFAAQRCDRLIVLLGVTAGEPIPGPRRLQWLREALADQPSIEVRYVDDEFPQSATASRLVSKAWADYLRVTAPELTHIFTSEPYGDYVAEYLGIAHVCFDQPRAAVPVSASLIRANPVKYWDYIPAVVRPWLVPKVCLMGPESTGKSTLAAQLAAYFGTSYIEEQARYMMSNTAECTPELLLQIGEAQARGVQQQARRANRVLFCDSDLETTRVYGRYLFGQELEFPAWVQEWQRYDFYLFPETDVPYVQDGSRLGEHTRTAALRNQFFAAMQATGVPYVVITGTDWDDRFRQAVAAVTARYPDLTPGPSPKERGA